MKKRQRKKNAKKTFHDEQCLRVAYALSRKAIIQGWDEMIKYGIGFINLEDFLENNLEEGSREVGPQACRRNG